MGLGFKTGEAFTNVVIVVDGCVRTKLGANNSITLSRHVGI